MQPKDMHPAMEQPNKSGKLSVKRLEKVTEEIKNEGDAPSSNELSSAVGKSNMSENRTEMKSDKIPDRVQTKDLPTATKQSDKFENPTKNGTEKQVEIIQELLEVAQPKELPSAFERSDEASGISLREGLPPVIEKTEKRPDMKKPPEAEQPNTYF